MFRNKYFLRAGAGILLAGLTVLWPEFFGVVTAHAQGTSPGTSIPTTISLFLSYIITALTVLMWVVFRILEIIMDPIFIFDLDKGGAPGGLVSMMHRIWMLSRDLMNIIFALLLIVGAVLTVVQAKGELVKTYMGKFVLAVVLINFSWFIPRVIFDVATILTHTVYQIPAHLSVKCRMPDPADGTKTVPCEIVTSVVFFDLKSVPKNPDDPTEPDKNKGWDCAFDLVCWQTEKMESPGGTISARSHIFNGLVINAGRLKTLPFVLGTPAPGKAGSPPAEILLFAMKLALVLVIAIALFFPLVALAVAFFIRIPILWLTMAFMPFAFLGFLIGDKLGGWNPTEKIWKRFLSAAFLPALVAIPFAVGFILLFTGMHIPPPAALGALGGTLPLFKDVSSIWQFLWMLLALIILWMGVFGVLNKDEIIGKFTAPIESVGKSTGKLGYQLPMSIPFIPVPGGGGQAQSLMQFGQSIDPRRRSAALAHAGAPLTPKGSDAFNKINAADSGKKNAIRNNIRNIVNIHNPGDQTKMTDAQGKLHNELNDIRTKLKIDVHASHHEILEALKRSQDINISPDDARKLDSILNFRP